VNISFFLEGPVTRFRTQVWDYLAAHNYFDLALNKTAGKEGGDDSDPI